MSNKTIFINGANSGIGKQSAIQLAQIGFHVFVGARNEERGQQAVIEIQKEGNSELVELVLIDLSSKKSIVHASEFLHKKLTVLDVLIHNAADFDIARKTPITTIDGIESTWATNHIGPIQLTNSLLPLLKNSQQGRVITIASKGLIMHSKLKVDLKDPEFKHHKFTVPKAYYQSKLAQVMYTYWLAKDLQHTKITVNCIRVTNVKVDINRYPNISRFMKWMYQFKSRFSISAKEMAQTYVFAANSKELDGVTGKYFDENNRIVESSSYSQNEGNIDAVMALSDQYL